jgi:hypothetical protein
VDYALPLPDVVASCVVLGRAAYCFTCIVFSGRIIFVIVWGPNQDCNLNLPPYLMIAAKISTGHIYVTTASMHCLLASFLTGLLAEQRPHRMLEKNIH